MEPQRAQVIIEYMGLQLIEIASLLMPIDLCPRYPFLQFSYIILDRGIHQGSFCFRLLSALIMPEILYQFKGIVGDIEVFQARYVLPPLVQPKPMVRIPPGIIFENLI